MSTFDPREPAVLHEQRFDKIVPWTDEYCEDWKQRAEPHGEGVIQYNGLLIDGWGNPLGG